VRMGVSKSYRLADIILLIFVLISLIQLIRTSDFPFFHAMLLSALLTRFVIQLTKKFDNDYIYLAGIDGMMLVQTALVAIGTI